MNLPKATWRKSSYSQGGGTECVEVADLSGRCGIRDSKDPDGPVLTFAPGTWSSFLTTIKTGIHNLH